LADRAGARGVHEYLIDQANLRGFLGAYSDRTDLGGIDPQLDLEDIVVGLLMPHAPAEARAVKLVVRILQSGRCEKDRLLLRARRERADPVLAWVLDLIPEEERNEPIRILTAAMAERPPRETRRPRIRYEPSRLIRRRAVLR
jgi:hypothetical protein